MKKILCLVFLLVFANTAFAGDNMFTKPYVSASALNSYSGELLEQATKAMEKGVSDQTKYQEEWTKFFRSFHALKNQLDISANNGNWTQFEKELAECKILVGKLEAELKKYPTNKGNENYFAFFRQDFRYTAQNSGLASEGNLEEIFQKGFANEEKKLKAASFIINVFGQAYSRGYDAVSNIAKTVGEKPLKDFQATIQAKKQEYTEVQKGSTSKAYFGGFFSRFWNALMGGLGYTLIAFLFGLWCAKKTGILNLPIVASSRLLLVVLPWVLIYTFIPFIPEWVLLLALLGGFFFMWSLPNKFFDKFPAWMQRFLKKGDAPQGAGWDTHGTAAWGNINHAAKSGHIAPKEPSFALGRMPENLPDQDNRFRFLGHITTCAPTGAGKGIGAVIPNLLEYPGSVLVLDLKGENYAVTAQQRRALGHQVFCVDPFNVTKTGGNSFNVLGRVDLSTPDCVGESASIADSLIIRSKGDAVHWEDNAQSLLQGLILWVKTLEPEKQNLAEVRRLLTQSQDDFDVLLAEMAFSSAGYDVIARIAKSLASKPDKERGSIISTAQTQTAFLDDPRIAEAMSRSDFNLPDIKKELISVFLVLPPSKLAQNARFVRAFVSSALAAITSTEQKPPYRVAFLLDEFAQLGYMKQIEDSISLVRGYGVVFWLFIQDLSQLKGVYDKWQTFLANSAKVFFGTSDFDTAKYISDSLGEKTIEYKTSGQSSSDRSSSTSESQQVTGRNLLTPDEVMRLGPERPLVLISGEYPYQLRRLNYLKDEEYKGLYGENPYHS